MNERLLSINSFMGGYRFLSNFWPAWVTLDGLKYQTVEHAYQAAKTVHADARERIRVCRSPGDAKRLGKSVAIRADWESIKLATMEDLVRQKFAGNQDLARQLLNTTGAELIEGNTWGDQFWGVCRGHGENHLGKILMRVRAELIDSAELLG